ncbi:MAG: DUF3016 domain-containing protein [Pseudomonadota bacterium]|nr:DUF3016 domain-containing protein [Pseudomonadota bacterium]
MRTDSSWRPAVAACVLTLAAMQGFAAGAAPSGAVAVEFLHPERYTDIGSDPTLQAGWMTDLSHHLAQRAAPWIAPGDRLSVTITDVNRAGTVRHGVFRDVRVVRDDAQTPRIDLRFQLISARGEVLKEGTRRLGDLGFRYRSTVDSEGNAAIENRLVDDWLAREFKSGTAPVDR